MKRCPYCGEMIDNNLSVCPICCETLQNTDQNYHQNTYQPKGSNEAGVVIGIAFFIIVLCGILFFCGIFGNTMDDLLMGCSIKEEFQNMRGSFRVYNCANKPYKTVVKAGILSPDHNPSYLVYDRENKCIGKMSFDYNFHRYNCAYRWDQVDRYCTETDFVSNLKQYFWRTYGVFGFFNKSSNKKEDYNNSQVSENNETISQEESIKDDSVSEDEYSDVEPKEVVINDESSETKETYETIHTQKKCFKLYGNLPASYTEYIERTLEANWNPLAESESNRVVLSFYIDGAGNVYSPSVYQSSGIECVDEAAEDALRNSAPFWGMPDGSSVGKIYVKFVFDYKVLK